MIVWYRSATLFYIVKGESKMHLTTRLKKWVDLCLSSHRSLTWFHTDIVRSFLCFFKFLFYFISFFLWVLYFSLVAPAICYLFFLHVVLYVFLANKWWWLLSLLTVRQYCFSTFHHFSLLLVGTINYRWHEFFLVSYLKRLFGVLLWDGSGVSVVSIVSGVIHTKLQWSPLPSQMDPLAHGGTDLCVLTPSCTVRPRVSDMELIHRVMCLFIP